MKLPLIQNLLVLVAGCLATVAGCLQATVSDSISVSEPFSYVMPYVPTVPAGTVLPPVNTTLTQTVPVDVSDVVSKLSSLGSLSFNLTNSTLTASQDFGFVNNVAVSLQDTAGALPSLMVANDPVDPSSDTVQLPVQASSSDLLNYLGNPCNLTVVLSVSDEDGGTPIPSQQTVSFTYSMTLRAAESVSKSL